MRVNQGSGRIFAACHWQGMSMGRVGACARESDCL